MSNLIDALSHTRLLIDKDKYKKNIEEPTPLEEKCKLVAEVKQMLVDDLLSQGVRLSSILFAWDMAESTEGADEALNKGFLYSVLSNIQDLEEYYLERSNDNVSTSTYWKYSPQDENLSELF